MPRWGRPFPARAPLISFGHHTAQPKALALALILPFHGSVIKMFQTLRCASLGIMGKVYTAVVLGKDTSGAVLPAGEDICR